MASEKDATCENDPNFAIICAFFQKFSNMLSIQPPDIHYLQEWLENTDEVAPGLKDLHIKLMRKLRKTVHETAWETALAKFCYTYSMQDAWEIERFGYKKSNLKIKIRILKELLESQFERNGKFRNTFSALTADELRSQPIGRDKLGHAYWFTQDRQCNLRIYQEHLDEEIWQVVATNRDELVTLINRLKGNEVVLPSLVGVVDEDSSSNSYSTPIIKPPPPEERDESQDEKINIGEEKIPNIKIKLDTCTIEKVENENHDVKVEYKSESESDYMGEEDEALEDGDESLTKITKEEKDEHFRKSEDGDENEKNSNVEDSKIHEEKKIDKGNEKTNITSKITEKKVKPIVISQSKIASLEGELCTKKRVLEDLSEEGNETENVAKKCRPTLLGVNREKKISKYEKFSEECEEEEETEECDEEEGEEEEASGEEEEAPAEEEETPIGEEEAPVEEEDDAESAVEEEVGEEVEEDTVVIKCEGDGKDCENANSKLTNKGCELDELLVGEAIEEDVMLVVGEGSGAECLVGNPKESDEKEVMCKIQCPPVNASKADLSITPRKEFDVTNDKIHTQAENNGNGLVNGEQTRNEKELNEEIEKSLIKSETDTLDLLDNNKEEMDLLKDGVHENENLEKIPEVVLELKNEEDIPKSDMKEIKENIVKPPIKSDIEDNSIKEVSLEVLNEYDNVTNTSCKTRKRRLSDGKRKQNSESETDLTSTNVENQTEEEEEDDDVGGKRPRMRCKATNIIVRKRIEAERNDANKEDSSSDEETQSKKLVNKETEQKKNEGNDNETVVSIPGKEEENTNDKEKILTENNEKDIKDEEENLGKNSISGSASTEKPKIPEEVEDENQIISLVKTRSGRILTVGGTKQSVQSKRKGKSTNVPKNRKTKKVIAVDSDNKTIEKCNNGDIQNDSLKQVDDCKNKSDADEVKQKDSTAPFKEEIEKNAESLIKEVSDDLISTNQFETSTEPTFIEDKTEKTADKVKPDPPKRKPRRKREIDISNIIEPEAEIAPVRQSRRIAQLKIKEEAERRKLEEIALKKMKQELKKKKKEEKKVTKDFGNNVCESSDKNESYDSELEMKKRLEKKKRCVKKGGWTSGSDEEEEDAEEFQYETDVGSPLFKSDHEFSPESDIEDESQIVPLKRARTVRKEGEDSAEDATINNEACQKCGKTDHPEWILLCDKCDKGYHCSCLSPVLFIIPEGDWFCPPCQEEQLIQALEEQLKQFDELLLKKKEEEEERLKESLETTEQSQEDQGEETEEGEKSFKTSRRRGSRIRGNFSRNRRALNSDSEQSDIESDKSFTSSTSSSGTSASSSSRSSDTDSEDEPIYKLRKRRQVNVSYRFHEYDDLINSAIKREMDEVAGAGNLGRGKDISTIIEADREEKFRQKQLEAEKQRQLAENDSTLATGNDIQNNQQDDKVGTEQENKIKDDSGSDFEPLKTKPKISNRRITKKKRNRKLNCLDISSDDDGSDEDFKTSSYETEEEDESISAPSESDSSLEEFKRKSKKHKKGKRGGRRAARRRRRRRGVDDFIVADSEDSVDIPKTKKKRKIDSDYTETESEDEISEDLDSDDICDDSTDSDESDHAWKPSKRKKQKKTEKKKSQITKGFGKVKRRSKSSEERSFKGVYSKKYGKKFDDDDDDDDDDDENSMDSGRRTRGKRFTYLEDYDDESSDDGIKPGVKRPDTPPEEREKFIKRQEEIKRMLAEKNTEAAKAAATPTLAPINRSNRFDGVDETTASLSTVPLSVIKGAKVLDIDYLQRKGELQSDDAETDFDDDLPDDFNPDDMDEEEIAKMMEEEDFAQHQLKLAGEVIRQKKLKENDSSSKLEMELIRIPKAPLPLQEAPRKRLPMPTIHPLLGNPSMNRMLHPTMMFPRGSLPQQRPLLPPSDRSHILQHLQSNSPSYSSAMSSNNPNSASPGLQSNSPVPSSQLQSGNFQINADEPAKPRGRRKKITPLRDTLQKQQAAAAAAAAAATSSITTNTPCDKNASLILEKSLTGPSLSVAQPPQLYKPATIAQPSVITRMAQPPRTRFPEQGSRYYPALPNQVGQRPSVSMAALPHHSMRPSYSSGPPPLRPVNSGPPVSLSGAIHRPHLPRQPPLFANAEQFSPRSRYTNAPLNPYRPPLYGAPGYPPAPPGHPVPGLTASAATSNHSSASISQRLPAPARHSIPPRHSSPVGHVTSQGHIPGHPIISLRGSNQGRLGSQIPVTGAAQAIAAPPAHAASQIHSNILGQSGLPGHHIPMRRPTPPNHPTSAGHSIPSTSSVHPSSVSLTTPSGHPSPTISNIALPLSHSSSVHITNAIRHSISTHSTVSSHSSSSTNNAVISEQSNSPSEQIKASNNSETATTSMPSGHSTSTGNSTVSEHSTPSNHSASPGLSITTTSNHPTPSTLAPVPSSNIHPSSEYSAPAFVAASFESYYPPSIENTHSTPPPPTATAVPSSVIVTAAANSTPSCGSIASETSPRPRATPLETFDSKSTPPPEVDGARSPYSITTIADDPEAVSNTTSEFSGLVSYFSSQQDDLNT